MNRVTTKGLLQAGIASSDYPDQLLIALEPEAASIYCRKLRMHQLVPEKPVQTPLNTLRRGETLEPISMEKLSDDITAGACVFSPKRLRNSTLELRL